jgi:hypothetical protein
MRKLLSTLIALFGFASLMLQVGPHDAGTNFCNWVVFWRDCPQSLPVWFSQWAWVFPAVLFFVAIGVFVWPLTRRLRATGNGEFISLESATSEAYGAARNTDIGLAAEKMNTNGVLAWFTYYYHTQGIPIYGNVRNSTRVEPVSFKNIDIKVESNKLVGKEIYGALIWENLQVRKSDQKRLLKMLKQHAQALRE